MLISSGSILFPEPLHSCTACDAEHISACPEGDNNGYSRPNNNYPGTFHYRRQLVLGLLLSVANSVAELRGREDRKKQVVDRNG